MFSSVCQNITPQTQGYVSGSIHTQYHKEDIKPDAPMRNKIKSSSKYQAGDNITFLEKEEVKKLLESIRWPKLSGAGQYDHMELIDYINGLFIYVPRIPRYWITAKLNKELKGHSGIWYTEMKEIDGGRVIIKWYIDCTHLKMTSTQWKKIHMSGFLNSPREFKPLTPI
ncbi:hypothetical protein O181_023108 [Austropuccinia psidii MF-1]|uniref:Uncharacterized protein n=1 Tax=Austropuccinia psidii MF-1 TaxID=1389203 RepID=A0A9Q3CGF8_9BASI|nr:hypothetical protein [Austropuccinia psidii MF-1]